MYSFYIYLKNEHDIWYIKSDVYHKYILKEIEGWFVVRSLEKHLNYNDFNNDLKLFKDNCKV